MIPMEAIKKEKKLQNLGHCPKLRDRTGMDPPPFSYHSLDILRQQVLK